LLEIDPADRTLGAASRKSSGRIVLIVAGMVTVLALAGIALFWGKLNGEDRFSDLYASLHTEPLPVGLQNRREILPLLERLQKERCDDKAATSLSEALIAAGEKRDAARILAGFAEQCPRFNGLMYKAADYYCGLSDYAEARKISDRLVTQWPEIPQFHYLAGQIDMGQGLAAEALGQFQDSIELTPDRHSLTQQIFLDTAKAFAQLGQYCKSASAMQQWVSLDPPQRDNFSSQKLVSDYLTQGHCTDYAQGSDSFPRTDKNVVMVSVSVGAVAGRFIVDSGATMVTLTGDFARKAGVAGDHEVLLKTANGSRKARTGTIAQLSVGRLKAADVTAAVLSEEGETLGGPGIDGLLGMSFLSRFRMEVTSAAITLGPHL
jgi:aspartyl protease family protein